jgi:hypothetical protein
MSNAGIPDPKREVQELREKIHRYQITLVSALALFGVATLAAIALVSLYGFRLARSVSETESTLADLRSTTEKRTEDLERAVLRQQQELTAIRKAANDELEAMREANRKLQSVRDPGKELSALREANEALWRELASQRKELLDAFGGRESESGAAPQSSRSRFRLGETTYFDPAERPDAIKGFVKGDEKVYRASTLPSNPAVLLIEVHPEEVVLGEPYRLSVRLVNRSNRSINPRSMKLEWSFQGKNTGGDVPVEVNRVAAQETALLYSVSSEWTEAHLLRPVSVAATVTVDGGAQVRNVLSW